MRSWIRPRNSPSDPSTSSAGREMVRGGVLRFRVLAIDRGILVPDNYLCQLAFSLTNRRKAYDQTSLVAGCCAHGSHPGVGREARSVHAGQPPRARVQGKPRRSTALASGALGDPTRGERAVERRQRHPYVPRAGARPGGRRQAGRDPGIASESWELKDAKGGTLTLQIRYDRGTPVRAKIEGRPRSGVDPTLWRIYRIEQSVDVVKSIPEGIDRMRNLRFRNNVAELDKLFDGKEQLISVTSIPWYTRQTFLPDL